MYLRIDDSRFSKPHPYNHPFTSNRSLPAKGEGREEGGDHLFLYHRMTFTTENIFLLGSLLVFVSILISKTGYRFGLPALLVFLFTGMLFGSDGLGLQFNSPKDAQFVGMLSLSIILFTGGMDTKFRDIRPVLLPGLLLSTLGVVFTTLLTGGFIYLFTHWMGCAWQFALLPSLLLAATMSSTDSASVFSLLRSQGIGLKHRLRPMLELESGSNDPMAYMIMVALLGVIGSGQAFSLAALIQSIAVQFILGTALGYGLGRFSVWVVNRISLPNGSLYPVMLLSLAYITFTLTEILHGNGYLAVYIAGLVVGNSRLAYRREMTTFMEGLTWLLQIVMFLTLGLLVNPTELFSVAGVAISISLFLVFVARPISVHLCLLPFHKLPFRAQAFLSWVGLRGAVPIIFATYPVIQGVEGADSLFNIVFFVTLISLLFQGTTLSMMARWLGLDMPEETDGNRFGVELPEELRSELREVTLTPQMLEYGNRLALMDIAPGTLVMMVKRGDRFMVPNGQLELKPGDVLLVISEEKTSSPSLPQDEASDLGAGI